MRNGREFTVDPYYGILAPRLTDENGESYSPIGANRDKRYHMDPGQKVSETFTFPAPKNSAHAFKIIMGNYPQFGTYVFPPFEVLLPANTATPANTGTPAKK